MKLLNERKIINSFLYIYFEVTSRLIWAQLRQPYASGRDWVWVWALKYSQRYFWQYELI